MKQTIAFICLAVLAGCNQPAADPDIGSQASRLITEQEARQIASDHANAFLKDKTFEDIEGAKHPFPVLPPTTWHGVEQTTNGWVLICEPPAGPYAHVGMDLNGKNVKVTKHGFSPE